MKRKYERILVYRVHRPHNAGIIGKHLGYIQLCQGAIDITHITKEMCKSKLIPENWFTLGELHLLNAGSEIYGARSYNIMRRAPYKTLLFYLHPIESRMDETSFKRYDWVSTSASPTTTGVTTLNHHYLINQIDMNIAVNGFIQARPLPEPARPPIYFDDPIEE